MAKQNPLLKDFIDGTKSGSIKWVNISTHPLKLRAKMDKYEITLVFLKGGVSAGTNKEAADRMQAEKPEKSSNWRATNLHNLFEAAIVSLLS